MGQKRKLGSLFSLFSLFSLEVRKGLFLLIFILFLLVLTLVSLFIDDILAFTLSPVGGKDDEKIKCKMEKGHGVELLSLDTGFP